MEKLNQLVSELTIARSTKHSSIAKGRYREPIPIDILIDIFLRLPSKFIARFRCVSKSWASILSRPYFTELFLTKSFNNPRILFTVKVYRTLFFFSVPQIPNLSNSSLLVTRHKTHSSYHEISSSLHGLVCCHDTRNCEDTKQPVICNPLTGEFLTLPKAGPITRIYCGYDPTDKRYKLLCLSAFFNTNRAWVLTLETGKLLWRMIECKPHRAILSHGHMICIDGVLYYLARNHKFVIVCFDVKSEKFSFINIDDKSITLGSTLINYKGRLAVVEFTDNNQTIIRVWLLEDALMNTWSNNIYQLPLSCTHPCDNIFQIVGMTRTCDIVLSPCKYSDPFYIYYYNVEGNTLARVEIHGLQELKSHSPKIYTFQDYVEDVTLMKSL